MKDIKHKTYYKLLYLGWSIGCWGMNKRGFMMNWSMMQRGMMYWSMVNKRGLMMYWGMVKWSMMDRSMMNRGVMDWMVERRVTNTQVSLQPPTLSLSLSKHHLVQVITQSSRSLGGLVPGGLRGLVHGLCVHGAHSLHLLVTQDKGGEPDHHQCGQIFL